MAKTTERPKAALVMGSDSDYPVLKDCIKTPKDFGVETEVLVCSGSPLSG